MISKVLFCLATAALTIASAATTYNITLFQPSTVNGKELQPGDYKVEVTDNKIIVHKGKQSVAEAPAKVETTDNKFSTTTVKYTNADGKYNVQEIRVGGTRTKIVLESGGAANGGL